MRRAGLCIMFAALAPCIWAQSGGPILPGNDRKLHVDFATENGKPAHFSSMVMYQLPICEPSGSCAGLFAVNPEGGFERVVNGFNLAGESRVFDTNAIEGLSAVQVIDFTPLDNGAAVLVAASLAADSSLGQKLIPKPSASTDWSRMVSSGNYLAIFDSKGKLSEVNELKTRFLPARIVSLGQDRLLVLGYDTTIQQTVLASVNLDGQLLRFLDTQSSFPAGDELLRSAPKGLIDKDVPANIREQALTGVLTGLRSGHAGTDLLILQGGSNASIWAIRHGGEIRKVHLKLPDGMIADSIVSSDGAWLVQSFIAASDTGILLEFDPDTGDVMQRIDSGMVPPTSIFFKDHNTWYALWWNKDQPFIVASK